jgi:hypothetical protein
MARLFSDDELRSLERPPRRQFADAVATGDLDEVRRVAASLERSFIGTVIGTQRWIGHTFAYASTEGPSSLVHDLVDATHRCHAVHPEPVPYRDTAESCVDEIVALVAAGDQDAAIARFDEMDETWRAQQDFARDWLSVLLSAVYRSYGLPELERALRYAAERTLFEWMPVDMAREPARRLPTWVRMLQGHWSDLRVEEDDEKFTLTQDPCGTCSRQITQGRYDSPLDLAIVDEVASATWHRGATPVYRLHVPVWHVDLASERVGVPWPVNQCPAGLGTGPCRVLLYKDPLDARAAAEVPRG